MTTDSLPPSVLYLFLAVLVKVDGVAVDPGLANLTIRCPKLYSLHLHLRANTNNERLPRLPELRGTTDLYLSSLTNTRDIEWAVETAVRLQPSKGYYRLVFPGCELQLPQLIALLENMAAADVRVRDAVYFISPHTAQEEAQLKATIKATLNCILQWSHNDEDIPYWTCTSVTPVVSEGIVPKSLSNIALHNLLFDNVTIEDAGIETLAAQLQYINVKKVTLEISSTTMQAHFPTLMIALSEKQCAVSIKEITDAQLEFWNTAITQNNEINIKDITLNITSSSMPAHLQSLINVVSGKQCEISIKEITNGQLDLWINVIIQNQGINLKDITLDIGSTVMFDKLLSLINVLKSKQCNLTITNILDEQVNTIKSATGIYTAILDILNKKLDKKMDDSHHDVLRQIKNDINELNNMINIPDEKIVIMSSVQCQLLGIVLAFKDASIVKNHGHNIIDILKEARICNNSQYYELYSDLKLNPTVAEHFGKIIATHLDLKNLEINDNEAGVVDILLQYVDINKIEISKVTLKIEYKILPLHAYRRNIYEYCLQHYWRELHTPAPKMIEWPLRKLWTTVITIDDLPSSLQELNLGLLVENSTGVVQDPGLTNLLIRCPQLAELGVHVKAGMRTEHLPHLPDVDFTYLYLSQLSNDSHIQWAEDTAKLLQPPSGYLYLVLPDCRLHQKKLSKLMIQLAVAQVKVAGVRVSSSNSYQEEQLQDITSDWLKCDIYWYQDNEKLKW